MHINLLNISFLNVIFVFFMAKLFSSRHKDTKTLRTNNKMNYPAAELRGIKMNFYLINPDAEHRGILSIKIDRIP
jgi:hypothetical protein